MSLKIKSVVALALSAAMLFPTAACGTSDASNSGDSSDSSNTTTGYDVSTIKKDDELAKLVPTGDSWARRAPIRLRAECTFTP